jgi:hypothetical protein
MTDDHKYVLFVVVIILLSSFITYYQILFLQNPTTGTTSRAWTVEFSPVFSQDVLLNL